MFNIQRKGEIMSERIQSVKILQTIIEEKVFYNTLKSQISDKNIAFCNTLVLTALRHLTAIEKIIKKFVVKKIPQKHNILKYVLLASITELMFLKSPDYAVINEYVNIAKKNTDKYAANMINAVLRKIASLKSELKTDSQLPENFFKILQKDYSKEQIKQIAKSVLSEAPLDLTIKENHEFWAKELNGTLFANGTLRLSNPKSKISDLKGYDQGHWWVQDLAASLPVMLLGDVTNKKVLDLCAAPGGKTAQLLTKGAMVTAVDIDASRMERLKQNIERLKLEENLTTHVSDASEFLSNNQNTFDIIVLDAPCSATGTFRKHPEVLHLKNIEDVNRQVELQQKLLKQALASIKTDGIVLYCTCSISKSEGEQVVKHVLENTPNTSLLAAKITDINKINGKNLSDNVIDNGVLRTLPYYEENHGGMDSFFAALIQKK